MCCLCAVRVHMHVFCLGSLRVYWYVLVCTCETDFLIDDFRLAFNMTASRAQ